LDAGRWGCMLVRRWSRGAAGMRREWVARLGMGALLVRVERGREHEHEYERILQSGFVGRSCWAGVDWALGTFVGSLGSDTQPGAQGLRMLGP
jgi:hypothetical protein